MEDRIKVSMSGGVADVRLVRADKMNALDAAMFNALVETSSQLARTKGLRAVVISGEGRAFCAGLDMGRFAAMGQQQQEQDISATTGGSQRDLAARTLALAPLLPAAVHAAEAFDRPLLVAVMGEFNAGKSSFVNAFCGAEVAEWLHAATIAVVAEVPLEKLWHAVPSFPTRSEVWLRLFESYGL